MAEPRISSSQGSQEKSDIVSRVKESATAQLTTQKDRGTDALGTVAQAVRSSTHKLREENHDAIAGYVERAADQIEDWSRRLRERNVDDLLRDVQRLARRQPAVFVGSAFALGLVGARFLKSSRQQNQYDYSSESPWLSAALVAIVTMIVGYLLVNRGLAQMRRTNVVPTQTIETLKETATWTTRQGA